MSDSRTKIRICEADESGMQVASIVSEWTDYYTRRTIFTTCGGGLTDHDIDEAFGHDDNLDDLFAVEVFDDF